MTGISAFVEQGLAAAHTALLAVRGEANLHLEPKHVTKSLRARVRARLKAIEVIVRRLIFLMAAALEPAPPPPAGPSSGQDRDMSGSLPGLFAGVEDVTASFRALAPPVYRLRLIGRQVAGMEDWREIFAGQGSARLAASGPVPAAPLLAHILALHRVLKKPEAAARRLARQLQQMKGRREPRPVCPPTAGGFRLGADLGLVASALPGFVAAALEDWPDPADTS